jgi:hypothetical protein
MTLRRSRINWGLVLLISLFWACSRQFLFGVRNVLYVPAKGARRVGCPCGLHTVEELGEQPVNSGLERRIPPKYL